MSAETLIIERIRRLPLQRQEEVLDFIDFLESRFNNESFDTMLATEAILKREWDTPEEDIAWAKL